MRIRNLDTSERVVVLAEIGNNHEGDIGVARELVERAAGTGVDGVKFQTFRTEHYVSAADADRFARLKRFELPYSAFEELAELARALGLLFVSTPFDLESARFLGGVADAIKVASGDNDFEPLLVEAAATGLPVVVSAGLAEMATLRRAVEIIRTTWAGRDPGLAVLHCVSAYPVEPSQANLRAIPAIADELDCVVGYSDHTDGLEAAPMAVALGARVVEKHFTLDRHYSDFRDHLLALEPAQMRELVDRIRVAEALLGAGGKQIQPAEAEATVTARRSIVAARDLELGTRVELDDLTWVRPGGGLRPGQESVVVGRKLVRHVRAGEQLSTDDVGES